MKLLNHDEVKVVDSRVKQRLYNNFRDALGKNIGFNVFDFSYAAIFGIRVPTATMIKGEIRCE